MRAFVVVVLSMLAGTALAQEAAHPAMKVWQAVGCEACHGAFAQGGGGGDQPAGPSLRQTSLDRVALIETISCGRPGTPMPYFLNGAYAQTACFGMPLAAAPADVNPGGAMGAAEIIQIVDYLMDRIVGKGAPTKAECGLYYGNPNHARCANLR